MSCKHVSCFDTPSQIYCLCILWRGTSSLNYVFQLKDIEKKVKSLDANGITWENICFR
jgi:hypothetical protein